MPNWVKVGTDVGVGAVAGVADQIVQDQDDKRIAEAAAAGKKLGMFSQYGTYLNYGVPLAVVLATAFGYPRGGDMQTRLLTASGELAGRKATMQVIEYTRKPATWTPQLTEAHKAAAMAAAARAAANRGAAGYPNIITGGQLIT